MKKKMLISIALVVVMLLNCIAPVLQVAATTDSRHTLNSELFEAVCEELSRLGITYITNDAQRTIIISDEEAAKVTSLSLSNKGLTDLTGLDMFPNLTSLDLSSNELTNDSNLEVLNSLPLTELDLSSNNIEDLSMVDTSNMNVLLLHNQKVEIVHILGVDTSSSSNLYDGVEVKLPQIVTEYTDYIKSEWLVETSYSNNNVVVSNHTAPYIYWKNFDQETLKVVYANKTESSYSMLNGMVKLSIKINDSTSTLYNSEINIYFVTASTNERGIYVKDTNMYKAIKEQLTKGQTVNSDLLSYSKNTNSRNLYNRYFDEPQVFVISINDLINEISSLDLSDKRIKDITGIEKFVGLETNLDLSGNYIKNIDKLYELEANQEAEEAELQSRVTSQISEINKTVTSIESAENEIKSLEEQLDKLNETWNDENEKLEDIIAQYNDLLSKKAEQQDKIDAAQEEIDNAQETYNNIAIELYGSDADGNPGTVTNVLGGLTKDYNDLVAQKLDKTTEIVTLQGQIKSLEDEITKSENNNATLQANLDKAQANLDKANTELTQINTEITNKIAEIDAKNAELANVQSNLTDKEQTIATYEDAVAQYNIAIVETVEKYGGLSNTTITDQYIILDDDEISDRAENVCDAIESYLTSASTKTTLPTGFAEQYGQNISNASETLLNERNDYIEDAIDEAKNSTIDKTSSDFEEELEAWLEDKAEEYSEVMNEAKTYLDNALTEEFTLSSTNIDPDVYLSTTNYSNIKSILNIEYGYASVDKDSLKTALRYYYNINHASEGEEYYDTDKEDLLALYEERGAVQSKIDALQKEIDEDLDAQVKAIEAEIETLNTELGSQDETNPTGLYKNLADKKSEIEKLTETRDAAQTALDTSTDSVAIINYQSQIDDLNSQIDNINNNEIPLIDAQINAIKTQIDVKQSQLEAALKTVQEKESEKQTAETELTTIDTQIAAKVEEYNKQAESMGTIVEKMAAIDVQIEALEAGLDIYWNTLNSQMSTLYTTYKRTDRLTGFATVDIRTMTDKEWYDLTSQDIESLWSAQLTRIASIEDYLTDFEKTYLIEKYSIPTMTTVTTTKEISGIDGSKTSISFSEEKEIEKPISTFMSKWEASQSVLLEMKELDIYFAMYSYCYLNRYNTESTTCVAKDYAEYIIKRQKILRESTATYKACENTFNTEVNKYYTDGAYEKCSGSLSHSYDTKISETSLFKYAKRMTLASSEEISEYITLPRLLVLDISNNLIENIDGIVALQKVVELYVYDNELVDISNVDWSSLNDHLLVLDLGYNNISDIKSLEVLTNIYELYLSHNLISGEFSFSLGDFDNLDVLDLSFNQITDIQNLINWLAYEARYYGYDGDIGSYLRKCSDAIYFDISYQQLSMDVEGTLQSGSRTYYDLYPIFSQIEEIDYAYTSFAIDSLNGNVTNDGKQVLLDTSTDGEHIVNVYITNENYRYDSIGYGTTCKIKYTVGDATPITITITPAVSNVKAGETQQFKAEVTTDVDGIYTGIEWSVTKADSEQSIATDTTISEDGLLTVSSAEEDGAILYVVATSIYDNTIKDTAVVTVVNNSGSSEEDPTDPTENPTEDPTEDPINPTEDTIDLGYTVDTDSDYLINVLNETPVSAFKTILLNGSTYTAVVKSGDKEVTSGNVTTGMFVQILDENSNPVKDKNGDLYVYEIVVKGDINGDGEANSIDSLLIKAYRNEVTGSDLTGAQFKAADINNDGSVNVKDSKLLLYHRAEVKGYNLNYDA